MTQRLTEAIVRLRYRQIKALLDQGVNINNKLDDGRTPLMVTLDVPDDEKRRHMFRFLVHHGAEMLESDSDDVTIFQHCCRLGFLDLMEIILKKAGVSAVNMMGRDKHGRNALYHAVASEDEIIVNKVLDHIDLRQQSVDVPDNDGLTPLLFARRLGLTNIADLLIKRGKANPRICDRQMHMNAEEWAEAARRKEEEEQAHAKKLARERYMIFPPIDHATKRNERIAKMKAKTISMPNLTTKNLNISTSVSSSMSSSLPNSASTIDSQPLRLPSLSQSNKHSRHPFANGNDVDFRTKSIDSAITLLGLASQTADDKQYAQSFVSSSQHRPVGHAQSKSSNRQLQRTWATVMDAYSVQNTANFRKPAKAPSLPDINADMDASGQRTKMSTLAIIMRATRGGGKGKMKNGKHKLKSISESKDDGDHEHRGKLSRRKTSTLSTSSVRPDGKSTEIMSSLQEDETEWGSKNKKKKDRQNSSHKNEPLPKISVS
nr:uncharacterized protein LOC129269472 [Lytechinus pictus]